MYDILVYDIEVFKYDWFVTTKSLKTNMYTKIHNDLNALSAFYEENKCNIWAGHNINHYDNIILKCLLKGFSNEQLKEISNSIIGGFKTNSIIKKYNLEAITLYPLDIMQDAIRYSLKEVEGYLGLSIEESQIPFDIDRPLTLSEIAEVFKYNQHDVDATAEEITLRLDRLLNKLALLTEYNLPLSKLKYTNQQLCAEILQADYTQFDDGLQPYDISVAPINVTKYQECVDFFTKCDKIDYNKNLTVSIGGTPHTFSAGGLHGAIKNYYYEGELWLVDVASYYPNMMINFNLCSRAMNHPENFNNLVKKRMVAKEKKLEYKHLAAEEKNPIRKQEYLTKADNFSKVSDALKLPINTTSGAMKAPFSKLFDERNNNWMCITGQLLLLDLLESMEECITIIQSNTDGIIIIPHDKALCDKKIKDWEDKTGLILEKTIASKIFQKDVNNYILLTDTGKVKTKGGYAAQYHNEERYTDMFRRNMEILDDAIVDFLLYNKPIEETICNKELPLLKFQIIKKLGSMYDDIALCKLNENDEMIYDRNLNNVNRIFATTNKKYLKLVKKHRKKNTYDKVEGCPDNCLVLNYDIKNIKAGDIDLDFDWYINLAKSRIIDFILSTEEKKEFKKYTQEDLWLVVLVKLGRI